MTTYYPGSDRYVRHIKRRSSRQVTRLRAGGVALIVAAVLVTAAFGTQGSASRRTALAEDPRLEYARAALEQCELEQLTATTQAERSRARLCVADKTRVIGFLEGQATPTTPPASTTPSVPTPTTTTPPATSPPSNPPAVGFPSPLTTGVPQGWVPAMTRTTDLRVTVAGAVVQDVRLVNADLIVDAPDVTVRRVEIVGGYVDNDGGCQAGTRGLLLEDVSILPPAGQQFGGHPNGAVQPGGYTAVRMKLLGQIEGWRAGATPRCGPVEIRDSYAEINDNGDCGLHSDGLQGYGGGLLTVTNVAIDARRMRCGTAPFFYPRGSHQGNTGPVHINRLWVAGGGYPFRLGHEGTVRGLEILDATGRWHGPIDVRCSVVTTWDARIVTSTGATVRTQPCNTEEGF